MKSIAAFRNIIISSQVLSPLMGSSAFVLGIRHHHNGGQIISTTASSMSAPVNEGDYEFDFLAAATQAAIEREAREVPSTSTSTYYSKRPARTDFTAPVSNEKDYEFDFLAAATQAAVEREAREAQANQKVEEPSPFKVYPSFVSKTNTGNRLSSSLQ